MTCFGDLSYWILNSWASSSVHRERILNAIITMQEPELTLNKIKCRISSGAPHSVEFGLEPFVLAGILDRTPGRGRHSSYLINYDKLKDVMRSWETIDLNYGSTMDQHVSQRMSNLLTKNEPNGEYLLPSEGELVSSWDISNHVNHSMNLSMRILYMRERFGLQFNNWMEFASRVMASREMFMQICDNMREPDYAYERQRIETFRTGYREIDLKLGFKENMKNWFDTMGIEDNAIDRERYGKILQLPYIENNEIFNHNGEGEIQCL